MHGFLGRLADVLARHLLSWLHRRVAPASREWLDALTAESECADDGWQRLRWALGGVPLVWTINQRRPRNEPTRGTIRALIVPGVANIAAIAGGYAVIIPATYGATCAVTSPSEINREDARNILSSSPQSPSAAQFSA